MIVAWPGPCWVLLTEHDEREGHYRDRADAQSAHDDLIAEAWAAAFDETFDEAVDEALTGRAGESGRSLLDVVTDAEAALAGADPTARLGVVALFQRLDPCWGLVCGRCGRARGLDGEDDPEDLEFWTHATDRAVAEAALAELGAVCADCRAAAALGSIAAAGGVLLPDPIPETTTTETTTICPVAEPAGGYRLF